MLQILKPFLLGLLVFGSVQAKSIHYTLSMPEPYTHLFRVEMRLQGAGAQEVVAMPVWTPGSYLIREYAKNVQDLSARSADGRSLKIKKLDKNHWEVQGRRGQDMIISYQVYAFEHSVRTSYLNADHALVVPASVFMYWEENLDRQHELQIELPAEWSSVSTALPPFNQPGNTHFSVASYDILADSPLELGNQHVIEFEVLNKPHVLAIYGASNYVDSVLVRDFTRIIETEAAIFGGLPYEHYAFIVHAEEGRGGLEHAASSVNFIKRWSFNDERAYHSFLALISHEFFHLWNVKRFYPQGIADLDYDQENYLEELWVAEGFTSYYDEMVLYRAGLSPRETYLGVLKDEINDLESRPGRKHQSVTDASFDTWIKYYRPNEHSENATISYYNKGHLLGLLLDLKMISATQGKAGLDEVMRKLYQQSTRDRKGYTNAHVQALCQQVSGLDLQHFFDDYVTGLTPLPYAEVLSLAGIELDSSLEKSAWLGFTLGNEAGRMMIRKVVEDSPAWKAGLNVEDELLAIDGFRVESSVPAYLSEKIPGDRIVCTVSRNGILQDLQVTVGFTPPRIKELRLVNEPSTDQQQVLEKWLGTAKTVAE